MGFSFDCSCDWCPATEKVGLDQRVVDLSESLPEGWFRAVLQDENELLPSRRLILCAECYAARAAALRDAEAYLDAALEEAKAERRLLQRMTDKKRREIERQAYADGR